MNCSGSRLTSLDITQNPSLEKLFCGNNQLAILNVSGNPALQILTCDKNQLTSLNINNTAELYYLGCSGNQLKALDVSQSPALQILFCGDNQLTSLDVGQNPNLNILSGTSSLHIAAPVNDSGVWQMNLADLIGKNNLRRVTLATGGTSLSKGIVTFTGDEAPQALEYRYNTKGPALSGGSRLLHVRLTWDVPAKEPETPGGDETTPGKKQQTITVNQIIMRAYKKNEIFSLGAKAKGKLTYKISNTKVAIVSAAGKVKTVGYGEAVIAINAAATEEYEAAAVKVRLIIGPGAVKFSSVTSPKKGSLQFRWTYNSQVSGYELNCSADKNFTSIKKGTAKGSKNLAGSISGLKSGGIYYVRIRGYRLVSGKKIYGPWSAVKYCKVR